MFWPVVPALVRSRVTTAALAGEERASALVMAVKAMPSGSIDLNLELESERSCEFMKK
jgi:hypothetical protein